MSLYHEAAQILTLSANNGGSLKSLALGKKGWKSDAKTLYALTTEAAKWSDVLAEVVEKSGILQHEKILTPTLALLLVHDLLIAKKGLALPDKHGLAQTVLRHRARLGAEFTKARIRRGAASMVDLRDLVNSLSQNDASQQITNGQQSTRHPRWIRINILKTSFQKELVDTFADYEPVDSLDEIMAVANAAKKLIHVDAHIPDLVAITRLEDPTAFQAYKEGKIILQEKASCFPAYLLSPSADDHDIIDACAAPGNKTTHLAALLTAASSLGEHKVLACEKDAQRSKTLQTMVRLAGADGIVTVKPQQDFLRLDPLADEFAHVTALLLDPSCSGSGIVGRDEAAAVSVRLPSSIAATAAAAPGSRGKKRKRGQHAHTPTPLPPPGAVPEETPDGDGSDDNAADAAAKLRARLSALAAFQLRLLLHAMRFPGARRISYSTCSVHAEENEAVVARALLAAPLRQAGWRVLRRDEQVSGMRAWARRGIEAAVRDAVSSWASSGDGEETPLIAAAEVADACIRCEKGGKEGTMGFFVAGFVREPASTGAQRHDQMEGEEVDGDMDGDEWNGFSDDDEL